MVCLLLPTLHLFSEETTMDLSGNLSGNQNGTDPEYLAPDGFKILGGAILYIIFILSIIGNGLLFHALFCYMNVKNVTDMYFLHLACSDVALTIALPFAATRLINGLFFSEHAFKIVISVYYSGMTMSIILLTAIAVDQFSTVVIQNGCIVPVKRRRCAIGTCTVAWVVSLAVGVSCVVHSYVVSGRDTTGPTCCSYEIHGFYALFSIFLFAVIVFCYSAILWTTVRASAKNKLRTASLALCISVACFVCWAPHTILIVRTMFKSSKLQLTQIFAYQVTFLLALSHCCINPMIYLISPKYRKHVRSIICCEKVCTKRHRVNYCNV